MPDLNIIARDGTSFHAHVALPDNIAGKVAPCVIVIQEIFGVNKGIRQKCDWLASHGFIACAPDLFHQFEPRIELSDQNPEELQQAFDYFPKFDIDRGVEDIKATLKALRGYQNSNGKVGALGYCLGGKLAYLTSCASDIDACIGYYGVGIEQLLANANSITSPLMLHIAEQDGFVPPEAQAQIKQGLGDNPLVTLHSYENVDHAFTREGGDNYNEAAAKIADERSITFLKEHLTSRD